VVNAASLFRAEIGVSAPEARQHVALRFHGGDHKSPEYRADHVDDINLKHSSGTGASYLAARLERDRPDLAARVEQGELSASAAAEAGFRERASAGPLRAWLDAEDAASAVLAPACMVVTRVPRLVEIAPGAVQRVALGKPHRKGRVEARAAPGAMRRGRGGGRGRTVEDPKQCHT
jgi:hypothetical protein